MPSEQMVEESITNRKWGLKRFFWMVGSVILVIFLVLLISVYLLFPSLVRDRAERRLSKFSKGLVRIETVKADVSGQVYLEGIKFYDEAKRPWLSVEKLQATLAEWPSLSPVITEVEVDGFSLQILEVEGKFSLPLMRSSEKSAGRNNKFDISKINIKNAAITIKDAQDSRTIFDNLKLSVVRKENIYEFVLSQADIKSSETFHAGGKINPQSLGFDVSLQMKHRFTKAEMSLPFTALKINELSAEGAVVTDLKMAGRLNELSELQSSGSIAFDQWILFFKDMKLAHDLVALAKLDGQSLKLEEFSAVMCSGSVNGSISIEAKRNQSVEFNGQLFGRKLSFMELSSIVGGPGRKATKGSVSFNYNFNAKKGDIQSHSGDGQFFLDDADVTVFPIIPQMFKALGLAKLEPLKVSDVDGTFSINGPLVKIKSAHIANRFGAVVFEPGGTINLQTGNVDMYVMAVPLRQLDILARRVPLADIVLNLKDKLSRFHVKGHWSSPPAKLITKTPIKDIKEGTIGFLQDVSKNGGQFGQGILKGLKVLVPPKKIKSN